MKLIQFGTKRIAMGNQSLNGTYLILLKSFRVAVDM